MTFENGGKKILMLHGFVQSGKIFSSKTGGLRKSLKKLGYELHYPTAPIRVDKDTIATLYGWKEEDNKKEHDLASEFSTSTDTDLIYGWYLRDGPGRSNFSIDNSTLHFLHDYVVENGPFDGIMGFSQGAGLAGYLLTDFNGILKLSEEQQPKFKFFVSFSGFKFEPSHFQKAYSKNQIVTPSLHIQGELDTVVSEERSLELYNCFEESTRDIFKHPGGHFVPNSKNVVMRVSSWIHNLQSLKIGPSVPKPTTKNDGPELDDDLMSMINSMGKT